MVFELASHVPILLIYVICNIIYEVNYYIHNSNMITAIIIMMMIIMMVIIITIIIIIIIIIIVFLKSFVNLFSKTMKTSDTH